MPTFSKMSAFPTAYFREAARWLLQNRRDVAVRAGLINAEIIRIGMVVVEYRKVTDAVGNITATEERTGFSVSEGSSLARLVQAYIANGGNPMNISSFLMPDTTTTRDGQDGILFVQKYPGGGVVAPKSVSYNNPLPQIDQKEKNSDPENPTGDPKNFSAPQKSGYEGYEGGYLNTDRYYPGRMGGRINRGAWDTNSILRMMQDIRGWANQDIKNRLSNLEWRIIKLMDLKEQLEHERDRVLTQAFGSVLNGLKDFDFDGFRQERSVPVLIDELSRLIFVTDPETGQIIGTGANVQTGFLQFVFPDKPSEAMGAL